MRPLRPGVLAGVAVCAGVLLLPAVASAQDPDTPPPGTVVLGPLRITPGLVVRDMGVDNNVFNEPVDPKSDFTFTLTPRADLVFRVRRLRMLYGSTTDYVYYRKYKSERGTNASGVARVELDLGRLRPYATLQGVNTRSRLNAEVDTRARHQDRSYGAGLALLIASRTNLLLNATRTTLAFDPGEQFRGEDLKQSFDGRREAVDGGVGIDLTPLTRFTLLVAREQQRFVLSPDRNSNTWRVTPGLNFSPTGLVTGTASVGYRHFDPVSPELPDYSGLVATVTVGATIYGRHQLQALVNRDVQYSYDQATDYYVGTTVGLTWTSAVVGPLDLRASGSRNLMNYERVSTLAGRDTLVTYGGGVGYRFSNHARLGFNVEWARRDSDRAAERRFRNHRIFAGLTWGTSL